MFKHFWILPHVFKQTRLSNRKCLNMFKQRDCVDTKCKIFDSTALIVSQGQIPETKLTDCR